jgi:hypothetical protein
MLLHCQQTATPFEVLSIVFWMLFIFYYVCIFIERSFGVDDHYDRRYPKSEFYKDFFIPFRRWVLFVNRCF